MPKRVHLPDGNIGEFPDDISNEQIEGILRKQFPSESRISGPPQGIDAAKSAFYTGAHRAKEFVKESLPTAGGIIGGVAGATTGPGGAIAGAILGGGAGEAAKQLWETSEGNPQKSSMDAALNIAKEGGLQGLYELGGLGIAKIGSIIKPVSRGARLSYGAGASQGEKVLEAMAPEFDKTLSSMGIKSPQTIGEFEKVVRDTNGRLNQEYALALHPVAGNQTVPQTVADAIRSKITPNMAKTPEGRATEAALRRKASVFEQPWSIRDLDAERETISKRLRSYHTASPSSAASKTKLDASVMADQASEEALKDMLYGAADRSANKPAGYFKELKRKQSVLIDLGDDVVAHKKRLLEASANQKGAPIWERMHLHGYSHPTSGHFGSTGSINPAKMADPLKTSESAIRKGFPTQTGKAVRAVRSAAGTVLSNADIDALPIRAFFIDIPTEENSSVPIGPKTRSLQDKSRELRQANQ